ncbi:hypothetical protein PG991_013078 [Apiospora marii]|uniref:Uncharacterized protein n=1 Tax=Apiospora marii TaxID=335849 RepID=A0ABR1R5Q5_9PEZI
MRSSPFIALLVAVATPAMCIPEYRLPDTTVAPSPSPASGLEPNTDSEQQRINQTAVKELQSREDGSFHVRHCNKTPQAKSKVRPIREGIHYLETVPLDQPTYGEGCSRVSCSHHAAIWLCGSLQSKTAKTLPNWDLVVQAARSVHHTCHESIHEDLSGMMYSFSGEVHARGSYGDDWYVKVGKDRDNC